ncbi:MAG: efflux RND transporter periplasmic adaptor subunit [Firmicutes bacterium]|nr:efflux RND transporter periplasmic adaptor subunit [Bacillota bacterium]
MKKIVGRIIKTIIGLAVVGAAGYGIYTYINSPLSVNVLTVAKADFTDSFTEKGVVKSADNVECLSGVDAEVVQVLAAKNSTVKAGDTIALLSSTELEGEKKQHLDKIEQLKAKITTAKTTQDYNKAEIRNNIKELNIKLDEVKNAKNKAKVENAKEVSPQTYMGSLNISLQAAEDTLNFAKEGVSKAEQALTEAKEKVSYRQNNVKYYEKEVSDYRQLYDAGAVALMQLDEKENLLNDAQTQLEEAKQEQTKAEAELNTAKNALSTAQTEYDLAKEKRDDAQNRYASLNTQNVDEEYYGYTDKDFDIQIQQIQAQITTLEGKLQNDTATLEENELKKEIDEENSAIALIDEKIEKCTVKAPCSGVVTELAVKDKNRVASGESIAVIRPESPYKIEVDVLTNSEPYLKVGDTVQLTHKLKSSELNFKGTITEIYDHAEKSQSALGTDEYRVKTVITPEGNVSIKDGYEINATFALISQKNVISVPNSALFKVEGEDHLFTVKDGSAVFTKVKTGHKGATDTVITEGLNEGDTVIINSNTEGLTDGTKVEFEK